jgi:uncharacterized protein (TIGR00369 family)
MSRSQELYEYFKSHIGKGYPDSFKTLGKWLNPVVREVEPERLVLEFIMREEMGNPAGLVHGGLIAALIDETIGAMMFYVGEPHFKKSVSLNVNFLSGARPGDVLHVEARLVKTGKNISFGEAKVIRKDDERVIATGNLNLLVSTTPL